MSPLDGGMAAVASVAGALQTRNEFKWSGNKTSATLWVLHGNATASMVAKELAFATSKSVRTSTIILASFNIAAAFCTAISILRAGYRREKRNNAGFKLRRHGFNCVPAHDAFPFILSLGITIQSITFAAAQSAGLDGLVGKGCSLIAEFVLPAVFLAPSIHLICAIDMILRGLQKQPFAPRGKWNVVLCISIVAALYLLGFLVADFARAQNACFMSLYWYVFEYSTGAFIALVTVLAIVTGCAAFIFARLRSVNIQVSDRLTASRTICYLVVAIASNACLVPFFALLAFGNPHKATSSMFNAAMVAAVVSNVTGLMNGGLYLYLKSHTDSDLAPRDKAGGHEKQALEHRVRRNNYPRDPDADSATLHRVSSTTSLCRKDSRASFESIGKSEYTRVESPWSPAGSYSQTSASVPPSLPTSAVLRPAEPALASAEQGYLRQQPYLQFPSNAPAPAADSGTLRIIPPAITYTPDTSALNAPLTTPRIPSENPTELTFRDMAASSSIGALTEGGRDSHLSHQRNSSVGSSATVQIGLRFSNLEDVPPLIKSRVGVAQDSVYDLAGRSRNPLARNPFTQNLMERDVPVSKRPSPLITSIIMSQPSVTAQEEGCPDQIQALDSSPKLLQPVPLVKPAVDADAGLTGSDEEGDVDQEDERRKGERRLQEEMVTLSPMVYSPSNISTATLSPMVYSPSTVSTATLLSPRGGVGLGLPQFQSTKDRAVSKTAPTTPLLKGNKGKKVGGQENWI